MPRDKDLKHLVRNRMQKTGESFTAARAKITARPAKQESTVYAAPRAQWAKLAGKSDATIKKNSGHTWAEWVEILDKAQAHEWEHGRITRLVNGDHGVPGWWAQSVVVGYERIRGLRDVGQRRSGSYEATKSRTFAVDVATLFAMFSDTKQRRKWLPDGISKVRKPMENKSWRADWEDGTKVVFNFLSKGDAKSSVAVQHERLAGKEVAAKMKSFWSERFDSLEEALS